MSFYIYETQYEGDRKMIKEIIINPTPKVEIVRVKNGVITVLNYDGEDYILRPKDQFKGMKRNKNARNENVETRETS